MRGFQGSHRIPVPWLPLLCSPMALWLCLAWSRDTVQIHSPVTQPCHTAWTQSPVTQPGHTARTTALSHIQPGHTALSHSSFTQLCHTAWTPSPILSTWTLQAACQAEMQHLALNFSGVSHISLYVLTAHEHCFLPLHPGQPSLSSAGIASLSCT